MIEIHVFEHRAMATTFQARIQGEEKGYAAQAAAAAFQRLNALESLLSRFRPGSEICQASALLPGESLRLSEPVFACLSLAKQIEQISRGAFSATPAALRHQPNAPLWELDQRTWMLHCQKGRLDFDLGAIGKGFALDRMKEILEEWGCEIHLLVAGGSSIRAGQSPLDLQGWSCGLGDNDSSQRYWLKNCSLSGSGLAVQGRHILDPRSGQPAARDGRTWALCDTAAESDALSTAAMVLSHKELEEVLKLNCQWLAWIQEKDLWRCMGNRPLPARA